MCLVYYVLVICFRLQFGTPNSVTHAALLVLVISNFNLGGQCYVQARAGGVRVTVLVPVSRSA